MSAIGRVFLVLNLILAATFLGWASTALASRADLSNKLSTEKEAHASTKKRLEDENSTLRTELNLEKDAKETARSESAVRLEELRTKDAELTQEKSANTDLRSNVAKLSASMGDYNATNTRLEKEKSDALQAASAAAAEKDAAIREREAALAAQTQAETEREKAQGLVATLEKQSQTLKKDNEHLQTKVETLVQGLDPEVASAVPVKDIDGRVLQVDMNTKPGLVALNVGTAQGVTRGMVFELYSGSTYKGRARIETVDSNYSSALILGTVSGSQIVQGDNATTKL